VPVLCSIELRRCDWQRDCPDVVVLLYVPPDSGAGMLWCTSMMTAILPNRRCSSSRNLINVLIKPVVRSKQRAPVCGNGSEDYHLLSATMYLTTCGLPTVVQFRQPACHLRGPCTHPAVVCRNPAFSGVKWCFVSVCHFCSRQFWVCLRVSILTFCTTCRLRRPF